MKGYPFPIFKTVMPGSNRVFRLEDPAERREYFTLKAGQEIERIRGFLEHNTFVGFLLGKKNAGKGTYSKLFIEAVGPERVAHISVGDIVRSVHHDLSDKAKKEELIVFLQRRYRGFINIEKALDIITGRDTASLLPTEVILALVEREIARLERKAIFIDGFPRGIDQISYSLYFRALIGYRDDPDFFVFIDVPEAVIDERMKYRVVCPHCHAPRNTKLLRTKEVRFDPQAEAFYLICDDSTCQNRQRMIAKEGDALGIEAIRARLEVDDRIIRKLLDLEGVPKVFLRNSIPVEHAKECIDNYEITPSFRYQKKEGADAVEVIEEPWVVNDDDGVPSYSLMPAPVAVSLIKQTAQVLGL